MRITNGIATRAEFLKAVSGTPDLTRVESNNSDFHFRSLARLRTGVHRQGGRRAAARSSHDAHLRQAERRVETARDAVHGDHAAIIHTAAGSERAVTRAEPMSERWLQGLAASFTYRALRDCRTVAMPKHVATRQDLFLGADKARSSRHRACALGEAKACRRSRIRPA